MTSRAHAFVTSYETQHTHISTMPQQCAHKLMTSTIVTLPSDHQNDVAVISKNGDVCFRLEDDDVSDCVTLTSRAAFTSPSTAPVSAFQVPAFHSKQGSVSAKLALQKFANFERFGQVKHDVHWGRRMETGAYYLRHIR